MAGFTEALRLVIDADTRGAIQEVNKFGDATARELSKSEKSLDKWGSRLSSVGVGMVAFGAAAVAGLGALAMESEQANLAQVKLQNTIANMPKLAGASAKEFTDLADSIQDVTAADADAIVEAEALLGTFNLTAEQIKGITPLVVDYARKFGIDMADAAVQVGKALDGQVGALKRNGVSIDETLFKTDRYRAVQEALSDQVGGFAEAEGKTFAGSLERLKNELGDLAEGVGGGAVDAFTTMFGAVDKLAGAFESISPGTQNFLGQIATFGAVGLVAVGAVSAVIGQVLKARDAFQAAREAAIEFGFSLTTLVRATAVVGGLVAIREILGSINDELDKADMSRLENQLLKLAKTGTVTGEVLKETLGKIFEETGPEGLVRGRKAVEDLDEALASLAARDPKAAAQAFEFIAEKAKEAGLSTSQVKEGFDGYVSAITEADTANRTTGAAIDEATGQIEDQAGATDDAAESQRDLTSALEDYATALAAQFDPLFGMISAQESLKSAQDDVAEAQRNLNDALAGGDPTAIAEAQRDYDEALGGAQDALFNVQQKQLELNDAINRGDVDLGEAQQQMFDWAIQAGFTADQALIMAGKLGDAASAAHDLGMQDPEVAVSLVGTSAMMADVANIKRQLDTIPRTVNTTIISTFKSFFSDAEHRQHGGPVVAGEAYIVGEKHAELFVPDVNGTILPDMPKFLPPMSPSAGLGGGGGGGTLDVRIDLSGGDQMLLDWFRNRIRVQWGGDVQAALGPSR